MRRRVAPLAFGALALALGSCDDGDDGGSNLSCGPRGGTVTRVLDGDTIDLAIDCDRDDDCDGSHCAAGLCGRDTRIRLVAIEAGEVFSRQDCLGAEARDRLKVLLEGRRVELRYDPVAGCTGDRGRLLAYVMFEGEPVQAVLLREGYVCLDWHRHEARKTETPFYESLDAAQREAQDDNRGIWTQPIVDACMGLPIHEDC